jgi:hypothetical protein
MMEESPREPRMRNEERGTKMGKRLEHLGRGLRIEEEGRGMNMEINQAYCSFALPLFYGNPIGIECDSAL